jgi:hypothetical protein
MSAENVSVRYRFEARRRGATGRPASGGSAATEAAAAPMGPVGTATAIAPTFVPASAASSAPSTAPSEHQGRIPRVARLVALAHRFQGLLARGEVQSMADLARLGGVTRARITQIMDLLLLAPDIQEALLFLPPVEGGHDPIHVRELRYLCQTPVWAEQRKRWAEVGDGIHPAHFAHAGGVTPLSQGSRDHRRSPPRCMEAAEP